MTSAKPVHAKTELLKATLEGSAKPSGVVAHKIDEKGLELKLFIPRNKLSRQSTRELLSLLLSDMM